MTVKNTALFAFACLALLTIVLLFDFIRDLSGALHGILPAVRVAEALIYLLAGLSSAVFMYVSYRRG